MNKYILICFMSLLFHGCFVDMLREESHETLLKSDSQWIVYKIVLHSGEIIEPNWQWRELVSSMKFDVKQNRIFGKAACNNYFANFKIQGKKLNINKSGSSRRLCFPNESMEYEMNFLTNLNGDFIIKAKANNMILESSKATYYLRQDTHK